MLKILHRLSPQFKIYNITAQSLYKKRLIQFTHLSCLYFNLAVKRMKDSSPARMKKNQIQVHTQHTTKCYRQRAQRQVKTYLDNYDQGGK